MSLDLKKRIITSIFLLLLVTLAFLYTYILIILLVVISIISWVEFNALIVKILNKKSFKSNFLRFLNKVISLLFITLFSLIIFNEIIINGLESILLYLLLICICSDTGGLIFGKIFKGKKLTKISPNKTISGSVGSFVLSLSLVPFFYYILSQKNNDFFDLVLLSIFVSFFCQLGDLFISWLKRKAKVKDTSNLLPGHGGFLDRIDGILFAIPAGMLLWELLLNIK
jgi:phosphatidate cytidylyltransferase